jgi:plasmid stability protein
MRTPLRASPGDDIITISYEGPMTDILIRNVDRKVLDRLKTRAAGNGRSLQRELQEIIRQAAGIGTLEALAYADRIRREIAEQYPEQTDSVDLIREDRDR